MPLSPVSDSAATDSEPSTGKKHTLLTQPGSPTFARTRPLLEACRTSLANLVLATRITQERANPNETDLGQTQRPWEQGGRAMRERARRHAAVAFLGRKGHSEVWHPGSLALRGPRRVRLEWIIGAVHCMPIDQPPPPRVPRVKGNR